MDSFAVADLYQTGSSTGYGYHGNPDKDLNGF